MGISVVILTKNEEENVKDCISTLHFADEIIVVDDNSIDKTSKIAESLGANVYKRELMGDFSAQRNFGSEKAVNKWVLFIDADERVPVDLAREIVSMSQKVSAVKGYLIRRRDFLWGRQLRYGEVGNIKLLRFVRKGSGKWKRQVHEYFSLIGKVGELRGNLSHYPHQTITDFLDDIYFYSTLHAKANLS